MTRVIAITGAGGASHEGHLMAGYVALNPVGARITRNSTVIARPAGPPPTSLRGPQGRSNPTEPPGGMDCFGCASQ